VSLDGSASRVVSVTLNGSNDVAAIGGVSTGSVTEDVNLVSGNLTAGGSLTIGDADQGQASFVAQASTAGSYGTFSLSSAGAWTYTASNSQAAVQQLGSGQSLVDSFTAVSLDGSASRVVSVTLNGSNDVAAIGGVSTGSVTEDVNPVSGNLTAGGSLTIGDADQGQASFVAQASTAGSYGTFSLSSRARGPTRRATARRRSSSSARASRWSTASRRCRSTAAPAGWCR
jgi:VCBS repeat-containing protein